MLARTARLGRRGILSKPTSQSYFQQVSSHPNLQSYWRMNETSSTMTDQKGVVALGPPTGSGFTRGATGLIAGDSDKAWQRGQSTAGLSVATDLYRFGGTAAFSIEFLMRIESFGALGDTNSLFRSTNFTADNWSIGFANTANVGGVNKAQLRFWRNGGSQGNITLGTADMPAATKYHIVGTYDGTNLRLYRNGVLIGGPTAGGTFTAPTGCSLWTGPGSTTVTLDELAIYNVALDATTIGNHTTAMG